MICKLKRRQQKDFCLTEHRTWCVQVKVTRNSEYLPHFRGILVDQERNHLLDLAETSVNFRLSIYILLTYFTITI
jgi:hypothetical protein